MNYLRIHLNEIYRTIKLLTLLKLSKFEYFISIGIIGILLSLFFFNHNCLKRHCEEILELLYEMLKKLAFN